MTYQWVLARWARQPLPHHAKMNKANVAETELSVLEKQYLDRRLPDLAALRREVRAGEQSRNAAVVKVD